MAKPDLTQPSFRAATALARGLGAEHPLAAEARRLAGSG